MNLTCWCPRMSMALGQVSGALGGRTDVGKTKGGREATITSLLTIALGRSPRNLQLLQNLLFQKIRYGDNG